MKRPTQPTGAVPLFQRIAEQRILEAQRKGEFDNLPGKGKPLELEDLSWVPEELRIGYHVLKNAHVLPPEAELLKDIHTLEDLLKHVEDMTYEEMTEITGAGISALKMRVKRACERLRELLEEVHDV